jgi:hypothetical protein
VHNTLLWPYDEVTLGETEKGVLLRAPWIEVGLDRTEENEDELLRLVEALRTLPISYENAQLVTEYFTPLNQHYLCYTLPTAMPEGLDDHSTLSGLSGLSFDELVGTAVEASVQLTQQEKQETSQSWESGRYRWNWDTDSALSFAALGERIHPESFFSVARRYHLLSLMENDAGTKVLSRLNTLAQGPFQNMAASLLRQNHYVTQKCEGSLSPAREISGRAQERVENFMKEERGHDRILGKALESLATNPNDIPVTGMTRVLMCLLEFSARNNFLAFTMAIDFFERRIYDKVEPLAVLLEEKGFSDAAKGLNQHKNINDAGEHHCVGSEFLEWMAACDPVYAREAMRLAEATSYVMSQVAGSVSRV